MDKKGQISFFIIIGIIMLIILGTYLALRSTSEQPLIPVQKSPVQQFVDSCLEKNAREAIYLLGQNSGFIYIPQELNNPLLFYEKTPLDTYAIPYWWIEGKSFVPTNEYVNGQITRYVQENIENCLDFSTFERQFDIRTGNPIITTSLNQDDISVDLSYPITLTDIGNGQITELNNFRVTIPIRVKKALELARIVMEREASDKFIEEKAIDLIALTSEDDVPYTGMEIKCGKKRWDTRKIKDILSRLLQTNLDFVKVKDSAYNEDEIVDAVKNIRFKDSYYGKQYVWDMEQTLPSTHVSFTTNKEKFKMNIRPNSGRYLESNSEKATQALSFLCINIWHFTYDLDFPVLVTIFDEKTQKNEDYVFKFAFQAMVQQNKPSRESALSPRFEGSNIQDVEEYCRADANDRITTLNYIDSASKAAVTGVNLAFTCGNAVCDFGIQNESIIKLPGCPNAMLTLTKDGYLETKAFIQSEIESANNIEMTPLVNLDNIEVVKHKLTNQRDSDNNLLPAGAEEALGENEHVFIQISSDDYNTYTVYPESGESDMMLQLPEIPDKKYKITINLIKGEFGSEDVVMIGGYEGDLELNSYELQTVKKMKFHVLEFVAQNEDENYLFMSGLKSYSGMIAEPEVIS